MALSKKQQSIIDIIKEAESIDKPNLFEKLEGVIENKKLYRSRFSSFSQTLRKLLEKGIIEQDNEHFKIPSEHTQAIHKNSQRVLTALTALRENQQALTLSNLKNWMEVNDWLVGMAQMQWSTEASNGHRIIDLDEPLEDWPGKIDNLLRFLPVDAQKIINSGMVFANLHHIQLQTEFHKVLKSKILRFALSQDLLKSSIEAKYSQQSPAQTINDLLEPATKLTKEECQQIANSFGSPYLNQAALKYLQQVVKTNVPFETCLNKRFPGYFTGEWEWDGLFQQLKLKVCKFAQSQGLYLSTEQWKIHLKSRAKSRFHHAQASSPNSSPPPPKGSSPQKPPLEWCYHQLGLEITDDVGIIRSVFRKLVKAHHPDQGGNSEFFRNLNLAYTTLITQLESRA